MTIRARRREELLVAALAILPAALHSGAAVTLDGPVFVAVARQILAAPLDPFGFQMLWDPTSVEGFAFNRNPPLLSYYLAAFLALFGESDRLIHLALLPFPLLAALAFLGIARRLVDPADAPLAAAWLVATPAFALLSGLVLLDVPVLACLLLAVYGLLRGREPGGQAWQWLAGGAAGAALLTKYVGLSAWPLLLAGALLLYPRRSGAALRLLLPGAALLAVWGTFTAWRYGEVHFLGATDVVFESSLGRERWNHLASLPVYFGEALLFPIGLAAASWWKGRGGSELSLLGLLLGAAAVTWVLPDGVPPRRVPLDPEEAILAALAWSGSLVVWGLGLRPERWREDPSQAFLALWLAGILAFSAFVNWHVNAADALLAAPPALLLVFRTPALRPAPGAARLALLPMLGLALLLLRADTVQGNFYRETAALAEAEIGEQPGARWFVGHWGLQHYLSARGFQPVPPTQLAPAALRTGDFIVTARNVSQLEVARNLFRYQVQEVWSWELFSRLPLRTTNGDAGAGFYSHHMGYGPFALHRGRVERVSLGRVVGAR